MMTGYKNNFRVIDFTRIKKEVEFEEKVNDVYSNFLVNYLVTSKKKIVKITNLTLKLNGFVICIDEFFKRENVSRYGYVEIIKKEKRYVKVRLTDEGLLMADTFNYGAKIQKKTYLISFFYGIFIFYKVIKKFLRDIITIIIKIFSKKKGNVILKIILSIGGVLGTIWTFIELFEWIQSKGFKL